MRHLTRLTAIGLVAGLAVTACGGSSNVLQGKSPKQIVSLASTSISSNSYHMTIHGLLSIDAGGVHGLPPDAVSQLSSMVKGATLDGSVDVESPQRIRATMTMKPLVDKELVVVLYDGAGFVSQDGGKTFADAGSFNFNGLPAAPKDLITLLDDVATVQDQGSTSHNGVTVEKLHATLGPDFISKVLAQIGGSAGAQAQQIMQLLAQAMSVQDGGIDLYVRHSDGRLESDATGVTLAVDMAKFLSILSQAFGGQLPLGDASGVSGSMLIKEAVDNTYSNYGAKITITKPTVDPNAPGLPSAGGLFGA